MNDVVIGSKTFQITKLDPIRGYQIFRKLAPMIKEMMPLIAAQKKGVESFEVFGPIFDRLAELSDEDAEKVLVGLLCSVQIKQPEYNSWAFVATKAGLMFQDIELPVLIQLAGRSFMQNYQGFLAFLPQK